jgi:poly(A) polymerase
MDNTDARVGEGKPVTPAFLFAVLLWEPVRLRAEELERGGASPFDALREAGDQVVAAQNQVLSIPKRFSYPMREIWSLQYRFGLRSGKRPQRLLAHPRFRAAYDFLVLRAESGETDPELAQWWTDLQAGNGGDQEQARKPSTADTRRKRRRRRRRPKADTH